MHSALTVANTSIRQDAAGRFLLNDLHRAAGGEQRHTPGRFTITQGFKELAAELSAQADGGPPAVESQAGVGTYVRKELVYAYAMWISAAFNLKVIRAYDALVTAPVDPLKALNDPATMRSLLLGYSEKVLELEAQVQEQAPKVAALDRIATHAEGALSITDAAKSLQVRPRQLFAWLSSKKWIYQRPGHSGWIAYQDRIQYGHLEHKVSTVKRDDGTDKVVEQVRVTPKGLARLAEAFATAEVA